MKGGCGAPPPAPATAALQRMSGLAHALGAMAAANCWLLHMAANTEQAEVEGSMTERTGGAGTQAGKFAFMYKRNWQADERAKACR